MTILIFMILMPIMILKNDMDQNDDIHHSHHDKVMKEIIDHHRFILLHAMQFILTMDENEVVRAKARISSSKSSRLKEGIDR